MRHIFFCGLLSFGLYACGSDKQLPSVLIASPLEGQVYNVGALISVQAEVADRIGLHGVHVHVVGADLSEPFHWEEYFDLMSFTVDTFFAIDSAGVYRVEISGEDHAGNVGTEEVSITVN